MTQEMKKIFMGDMKKLLLKSLTLEGSFIEYKANYKKYEIEKKFISVWGKEKAEHFLRFYSSAANLIFDFDFKDLELFITKF